MIFSRLSAANWLGVGPGLRGESQDWECFWILAPNGCVNKKKETLPLVGGKKKGSKKIRTLRKLWAPREKKSVSLKQWTQWKQLIIVANNELLWWMEAQRIAKHVEISWSSGWMKVNILRAAWHRQSLRFLDMHLNSCNNERDPNSNYIWLT